MHRLPSRTAALSALALLLVLGAACGSDPAPRVQSIEPPPTWTHQALAVPPGADREILVAERDGQLTVMITTEDDVVTSWTTGEDGTFVAGDPLPVDVGGEGLLRLSALAATDDGWLALGSAGQEFTMTVLRSTDGLSWESIEPSGFTTPGDVMDLAVTDEGLVAVGTLRTGGDPGQGPFAPVAWHSPDGQVWEQVPLPMGDASTAPYDTSYAGGVVDTGSELLVAGTIGTDGVLWSSPDDGASWDRVDRPGLERAVELRGLARAGDTLVASAMVPVGPGPVDPDVGYEARPALFRSTDAGRTWGVATLPSGPHAEPFPPTVTTAGDRFLVLASSFIEAFRSPEVCYADIALCRQDSTTAVHQSTDGLAWSPVATDGIELGQYQDIDVVTGTASGRVLALSGGEGRVDAWTWPAETPLPDGVDPSDPEADVTFLDEGEEPEPGVRYAVPLYIHCGMDWLYVGSAPWQRTDPGPDVETGAGDSGPDGWPLAQQTIFGFATLVGDEIEYSIGDGEVIATYGPAPEEPPGCD